MKDNPSLGKDIIKRYETLYSGAFYERFVLGKWVATDGLVYPEVSQGKYIETPPVKDFEKYYISCDYGTVNPTSMGLWGKKGERWYRIQEFYFNSRAENRQMTDAEYAAALEKLAGDRPITAVIVDPSAASFIELLRRRGHRVQKAKNDVLAGIRLTADCLKTGRIVICQGCEDCLREMEGYVWDLQGGGRDRVKKENDHAMDDMRYFVSTVLGGQGGTFVACSVERKR
jgi:PBSX family phage terminase large subunit